MHESPRAEKTFLEIIYLSCFVLYHCNELHFVSSLTCFKSFFADNPYNTSAWWISSCFKFVIILPQNHTSVSCFKSSSLLWTVSLLIRFWFCRWRSSSRRWSRSSAVSSGRHWNRKNPNSLNVHILSHNILGKNIGQCSRRNLILGVVR